MAMLRSSSLRSRPPVLCGLFDPDADELALAREPVDGLLDHEPEDLVDPGVFCDLEILEPVDRRMEPDEFDHLLAGGKRHIVGTRGAPLHDRLLGGEDEIAVCDRRADDRIHGPVLFELLGALGIFPGIDHLHAEQDIVDRTVPGPALVTQGIIEEFLDKRDIFGSFGGFEYGKCHCIDERVVELVAEARQVLIEGCDDLAEKDRDIGVDLLAVCRDIFDELLFQTLQSQPDYRFRLPLVTHGLMPRPAR